MEPGLRERKRARTRAHIAGTAARLFGERGFENTAVAEIARVAELSEQTVYNYFPTKESLAVDRTDEVRDRFVAAVRDRAPGVSPAAAIRSEALGLVEYMRTVEPDELRGTLGVLVAVSPAVRRLSLDVTDALADALAAVLIETGDPPPSPEWAKMQGTVLSWVSQTVIDRSGPLIRAGLPADEIVARLSPVVADLVDRLDRSWID